MFSNMKRKTLLDIVNEFIINSSVKVTPNARTILRLVAKGIEGLNTDKFNVTYNPNTKEFALVRNISIDEQKVVSVRNSSELYYYYGFITKDICVTKVMPQEQEYESLETIIEEFRN